MQPFDEFEDFSARRLWNRRDFFEGVRKSKDREDSVSDPNEFLNLFNNPESCSDSLRTYNVENNRACRNSSTKNMDNRVANERCDEENRDLARFERLRRLADEIADKSRRESVGRDSVRIKKVLEPVCARKGRYMKDSQNDPEGVDVSSAFRLDGPPSAQTTIGGRAYDYFGGDGYLGLQSDPGMIQAACTAAINYGLATATSRNCFTAAPVQKVERNAAQFFKSENAYYSLDESTLGGLFLDSLNNSFERAFVDEASAAFWTSCFSRLNGRTITDKKTFAARKELVVFKHCDPVDLQEKLSQNLELGERPVLLTAGVFADFGDIAPLREYEKVLKQFGDAMMIVDDSHGIGVLGDTGRGTLEYWGYDFAKVNQTGREVNFGSSSPDVDDFLSEGSDSSSDCCDRSSSESNSSCVSMYMFASLAKAVGGFGCVAAGSDLFVERLTDANEAFYAVPPNSIAAATAYALDVLGKSNARQLRLKENVKRLRNGLRDMGLFVENIPTPIVPIQIGSCQNMRRIREELERERFLTTYLPCAYNGTRGLLRIAVFATHSFETIDNLLAALKRILEPKNV